MQQFCAELLTYLSRQICGLQTAQT